MSARTKLFFEFKEENDRCLETIVKDYEIYRQKPWYQRIIYIFKYPDHIEYEVAKEILDEREKKRALEFAKKFPQEYENFKQGR